MRKGFAKEIIRVAIMAALLAVIVNFAISAYVHALAEPGEMYVICDPESHVNARNTPNKGGSVVGRLECGDRVRTDGKEKNGYTHLVDCSFEQTEAWVKTRYLTTEQPHIVSMTTVVMKENTLARNGIGGSVIRRLSAGRAVKILVYTPEWCLTNRGYIRTACLGVN